MRATPDGVGPPIHGNREQACQPSVLKRRSPVERLETARRHTCALRSLEQFLSLLVSFCSPLRLDRGHSPSRLSSVMRNHGSATIANPLIVARRRRRRMSVLGRSRMRDRNEMRKRAPGQSIKSVAVNRRDQGIMDGSTVGG